MKFQIYDWAYNKPFGEMIFDDFEDAWGFIYETFPDEENFDDYMVLEVGTK